MDYVYAAGRLIATTKPPTGEWHTLTVTHEGGAGRVTSVPAGLECDRTCTERFTRQTVVTLTATPGAGQTFSGWSGACTGTAPTTTVTITGDQACTAWFSTHPELTLTLAGSGSGHVETDPAGLSCDRTCTAGLTPGASVTLIATPHTAHRTPHTAHRTPHTAHRLPLRRVVGRRRLRGGGGDLDVDDGDAGQGGVGPSDEESALARRSRHLR